MDASAARAPTGRGRRRRSRLQRRGPQQRVQSINAGPAGHHAEALTGLSGHADAPWRAFSSRCASVGKWLESARSIDAGANATSA